MPGFCGARLWYLDAEPYQGAIPREIWREETQTEASGSVELETRITGSGWEGLIPLFVTKNQSERLTRSCTGFGALRWVGLDSLCERKEGNNSRSLGRFGIFFYLRE